MAVRVVLVDVVGVVGGQQRDLQRLGDPHQVAPHRALDVQVVVHQLQEIVLFAEDLLVAGRRLQRRLVLAQPQPGLHLPRGAAGGGDDPLAVLADQLAVHPRLHVVALEGGQRAEPEQVAQPGGVLRPHGHVGVAPAPGDILATLDGRVGALPAPGGPELLLAREAAGGRHIGLDADDRLHRLFHVAIALGDVLELVGAEHVAVVGHRDGGHALAGDLREELGVLCGAVEHRVLGVGVEVDEGVDHGVRAPSF